MFRHLLPNCLASLIVTFTMNVGNGHHAGIYSQLLRRGHYSSYTCLGVMVSEGYKYLFNQPLVAILPGICIMLVVIAFNVVGDALRDALDPRLRGKYNGREKVLLDVKNLRTSFLRRQGR